MIYLKVLRYSASVLKLASLPNQPLFNQPLRFFRKPSPCDICLAHPEPKPCFDIRKLMIERGNQCHAKLIKSFLYAHYWPREPSIVGLWMSLESPYLEVLTDKFAHSGDRFLAFERMERTNERKLIGLLVANKIWPWHIDELEEWAHYTYSNPERHHMYFTAHMYKSPGLFKKYNVPYIYDVEVLGTAAEATGQGVATALLKRVLDHSYELRHPLLQVTSVSKYTSKLCEHIGLKREWTMDYTDFIDDKGQKVFYPRRPHHTVAVYTRHNDPKKAGEMPCKPPFLV